MNSNVTGNRIGVLLVNLGTPEGTDYWSVRCYLSEFLSDPRVIDANPLWWQPLLQGVILTSRSSWLRGDPSTIPPVGNVTSVFIGLLMWSEGLISRNASHLLAWLSERKMRLAAGG